MSQDSKRTVDLLDAPDVTDTEEQGTSASEMLVEQGVIEVALKISRQRRDVVLKLITALERNDWSCAKTLAKELSGE